MNILILLLLVISQPVLSLIGFDCGGQHLNVTTVSLLGTGECNFENETPTSTNVYI